LVRRLWRVRRGDGEALAAVGRQKLEGGYAVSIRAQLEETEATKKRCLIGFREGKQQSERGLAISYWEVGGDSDKGRKVGISFWVGSGLPAL
jgi:hypothetical protein